MNRSLEIVLSVYGDSRSAIAAARVDHAGLEIRIKHRQPVGTVRKLHRRWQNDWSGK
jgi:hypothetical protein